VIKKDGTKTSEKKWVCRFCEKPFQGGPNVIQAHHGVHGTGKKKAIQLCKNTPAHVKAGLQPLRQPGTTTLYLVDSVVPPGFSLPFLLKPKRQEKNLSLVFESVQRRQPQRCGCSRGCRESHIQHG